MRYIRSTTFIATAAYIASLLSSARTTSAQDDQAKKAEQEAIRQYRVAYGFQKKKLFPQAAQRWTKFIQAFSKDKRIDSAHYHLGVCQYQQQLYPQATATFNTVLSKYPKYANVDAAQLYLGLVLFRVAEKTMKPDDFKKAASAFAALPAKFGNSKNIPTALFNQADCTYRAGDVAGAVPVYQKLIAGFPKSPLLPKAYYDLGAAQQELKKPTEASTTLQTFLQKFPKDELANEVRLRLGLAMFNQKKFADAEKLFAQTAAVADYPLADYAMLQQAKSIFEQDKVPESAAIYEALPTKFPKSEYVASALLKAGKCRYRADQFPQAQADLTKVVALKMAAEAPEANYWLARTLISLMKPADAVAVLNPAIAAYSKSEFLPQLVFARIDALYEQEARRKETIAMYSGFAKTYPKHELAPEALYRASLAALKLQDYILGQQNAELFLANAEFAKHELLPEVLFVGAENYLLAEPPNAVKSEALYRRLIVQHAKHAHIPQSQVRVGFCLYTQKKYDPAIAFLTQAAGALTDPSLLAEARLLIGLSHNEMKRPKEGIVALRASVAANAKWDRGDEVLFALGVTLRGEKDVANATAELTKLNAQFPKSTYRDRTFLQLAEISFDEKKFDVAIGHYRKLLAEIPKSELAPLAQFSIGSALFDKKDYQNSAAELGKLITAHPKSEVMPNGLHLRATCYQRLKQFQPALQDLTAFLATKPEESNALDARFALAKCQVELKQHPAAITTLTTLLKDKPDYPQADNVHYELAFAYQETKQDKEAATTFQQLATKFPDSTLAPDSWFRVGQFHENAEPKNLPEAAKAYTAGLTKAKPPEVRENLAYRLGWVQYEQKQFAEATKTFLGQVQEHAKGKLLNDATYLAGECLFQQRKFAESLPHFAKVIAAGAENYHARALYRSGTAAGNLKQWPASQQHFDALAKQFQKFDQINEARYGLGLALQNQKQLDKAKAVYLEVTKATNTETAAKSRFMMGECAFAQKKYEEAYEHFLEAALGYPYKEWQALGYFEAGRCFIELKQPEKARETLQTMVDKFPKHARTKDASALLANLKKKQ